VRNTDLQITFREEEGGGGRKGLPLEAKIVSRPNSEKGGKDMYSLGMVQDGHDAHETDQDEVINVLEHTTGR
jgi:hypothetical protein